MFAKRFAKKTSLLALSAALTAAMLAAPAQARPDDPENGRGRGAWSRSSQGQAATTHEMRRGPEMRGGNEMRRGGNPDTQRRWSRPAPNIAQPASPAAPRAEWGRRGGGWRRLAPGVAGPIGRGWPVGGPHGNGRRGAASGGGRPHGVRVCSNRARAGSVRPPKIGGGLSA